jgi:hypothetical protein
MSSVDEFLEYSSQTLEDYFGPLSKGIIKTVRSKKNLDETSKISDFDEFIDLIEYSIRALSGRSNAANLCQTLRTKVIELNFSEEAKDIFDSLSTEAMELDINKFLLRINAVNIYRINSKNQHPLQYYIDKKINDFLKKFSLPSERDITRFAEILAKEYRINIERIKNDIIYRVKLNIKNLITGKAIREEIDNFLIKHPEPGETDVNDFLEYLHLLKLDFDDDELRQKIQQERLHRKFHEPLAAEGIPELDQLIELVKTYNDKNDFSNAMQEQDLSYLIRDELGISDKLLFELIELIILIEKDSLNGLYLKRMVKKVKKDQ